MQPATRKEHRQARDVAGRERTTPKQAEVAHRLFDHRFDDREKCEQHESAADLADHLGARPAHRVMTVRLDPGSDAHHDCDEAAGKREVSPPIDAGRSSHADVAELHPGPDSAEHADRNRDQENQAPRDRREHATENKSARRARNDRDVLESERHAALVGRERVGHDSACVTEQHGPPKALAETHADKPARPGDAVHPRCTEQDGEDGKHDKPRVVDAHPPVDVAQATERDNEYCRHHEKPQDQPEHVLRIPWRQRVQADPAKDRRQSDQHDRRIDRDDQCRQHGVREDNPFVPWAHSVHSKPNRWSVAPADARRDVTGPFRELTGDAPY